MSNKLKIQMKSDRSSGAYYHDGMCAIEMLDALPPVDEYSYLWDGLDNFGGEGPLQLAARRAPESVRQPRLGVLVVAEVVSGPRDVLADNRVMKLAWQALADDVLYPRADVYDGRVVEERTMTLMLEFGSVAAGLDWATDVQRDMENSHVAAGLALRIGIGIGDIVEADGVPELAGFDDPGRFIEIGRAGDILITGPVRHIAGRSKLSVNTVTVPYGYDEISDDFCLYAVNWKSRSRKNQA